MFNLTDWFENNRVSSITKPCQPQAGLGGGLQSTVHGSSINVTQLHHPRVTCSQVDHDFLLLYTQLRLLLIHTFNLNMKMLGSPIFTRLLIFH
jgi:hypothetical protein